MPSGEALNKLRVPLALAAIIGGSAVSGYFPSSSSSEAYFLQGAGATVGLTRNLQTAQAEMSSLDQLGANTVEIVIPLTQGGADIKNDAADICQDVNAALDSGKTIVLRDDDRYRNGRRGYVPTTAHQLNWLYTRDMNLIYTLKGEDGNNGCAPRLDHVYYSPFNELNNRKFNTNQADAPSQFVNGYRYLNQLLPKEALERNLALDIVIGELAQKNMISFIKRVDDEMSHEKITGDQLGSVVAIHYYYNGLDAIGTMPASQYLLKSSKALQDTFGNLDQWVTEVGEITTVPSSIRAHYSKLPANIKPVSPEQQGQDITQFMQLAAKNGFKVVLNTLLQDDGSILRTGLEYHASSTSTPVGGTPKISYSMVGSGIKRLVPQK